MATLGRALGARIEPHGYTMFHQRIVFFSSVLFAVVACVVGIWLCRRVGLPPWCGATAGAAILLGTTLTYYATYMPSYVHAMDAATTALFVWLWFRSIGDWSLRRGIYLGAALGLCALVRTQNFALGILVAIELIGLVARSRTNIVRPMLVAMLAAIVAMITFVPQLFAWHAVFGEWITTPQGPGYVRLGHPMLMPFLFGSRNGWLSSHPIAYLAVLGLMIGIVRQRGAGRILFVGLLAIVAIQSYIGASIYDYWGSASFGQRRMSSVSVCLVPGLAALAHGLWSLRWRKAATTIGAALAISLVWLNITFVSHLRNGVAAGRGVGAMDCNSCPPILRRLATPIHRVIGNPFCFPASVAYAWQHDVSVGHFERSSGHYPLMPPFLSFADGSYRTDRAKWQITNDRSVALLAGFGARITRDGVPWLPVAAPTARIMVPTLVPEPHHLTVPLFSDAPVAVTVQLRWDARAPLRIELPPGRTNVTVLTDSSVGDHELSVQRESDSAVWISDIELALSPQNP